MLVLNKVLINVAQKKKSMQTKNHWLTMPRTTFIRRIIRCEMNIHKFDNDLQATPREFFFQIEYRIGFSGRFEDIRLRLVD